MLKKLIDFFFPPVDERIKILEGQLFKVELEIKRLEADSRYTDSDDYESAYKTRKMCVVKKREQAQLRDQIMKLKTQLAKEQATD